VIVIDTTPQPRSGGEVRKTLLREIDCVATKPDFADADGTRVVQQGDLAMVNGPGTTTSPPP
jgi:hypothetical protein